MSKSKIPIRPSGKYKLSTSDQDALSWYFLSGESQTEVYRKVIRPDLQTSKAALDKLAKAFFADKEVQKYLSDYEATINALFEPKKDAEDYSYVGGIVDLTQAVEDAVVFSLPFTVLCENECEAISYSPETK